MTTIDPQLFGFAACRVDCLWILLHAFIVVHRSLVAEVVPLRCQGKRGGVPGVCVPRLLEQLVLPAIRLIFWRL